MDEVLVAKIASRFTIPSSESYISRFCGTLSMMASITMSQSAISCRFVVPLSRARIASFCAAVNPPFSTGRSANLASDFSIPANPLSRYFCSTSSTVTSNPAVAQTCAMPEPIKPQPRTPTFLISIFASFVLTYLKMLCHSERSEEPMHFAGANGMHGSFASLRVTTLKPFSVSPCLRGEKSVKALHHHSNPLPAADARRGQPVLLLPPPQLIQQRDHEARSSRS